MVLAPGVRCKPDLPMLAFGRVTQRIFLVAALSLLACGGNPPAAPLHETPVAVVTTPAASLVMPDAPLPPVEDEPVSGSAPAPDPIPAWQSFATAPERSSIDRPQPAWARRTSVGLTLLTFDGKTVTGRVIVVAPPGLDATTCAVEVVWDVAAKYGIRLMAPPVISGPGGPEGTRGTWEFSSQITTYQAGVKAAAWVFCPLNNAHIDRPWGVTFSTGETVVAGPHAQEVYCKELRQQPVGHFDATIEGRATVDLGFACGALIRKRGRQLIDECRGDVLVSLDALPGVTAVVDPEGTPLRIDELQAWMSQSSRCDSVKLIGNPKIGAGAAKGYAMMRKRAGTRLVSATSSDGMIRHFHPPDDF